MIETEAKELMGKEKKTPIEIINIIVKALTAEKQSLNQIVLNAKTQGDSLQHETVERYLKIITHIQEMFDKRKVCYKEQDIAGRMYRTAWYEEK